MVAKLTVYTLVFLSCVWLVAGEEAKQQKDARVDAEIAYGYGGGEGRHQPPHGYYDHHHDENHLYNSLFPGPCPTPKSWCTCTQDLTPVYNALGCAAPQNNAAGQGVCSGCADPGAFGSNAGQTSYCPGGGAGNQMCYKVTCPSNGTLVIGGASGAIGCGGANCNPQNVIGLYQGEDTSNPILTGQSVINTYVNCLEGDNYMLCEDYGVLLPATFRFTFTTTVQGGCPQDGIWTQITCQKGV